MAFARWDWGLKATFPLTKRIILMASNPPFTLGPFLPNTLLVHIMKSRSGSLRPGSPGSTHAEIPRKKQNRPHPTQAALYEIIEESLKPENRASGFTSENNVANSPFVFRLRLPHRKDWSMVLTSFAIHVWPGRGEFRSGYSTAVPPNRKLDNPVEGASPASGPLIASLGFSPSNTWDTWASRGDASVSLCIEFCRGRLQLYS